MNIYMKTKILVLITILLVAFAAQVRAQGSICNDESYTINNARPASGTSKYRWIEAVNGHVGTLIEGATDASYTVSANGKTTGTYSYVRQAYAAGCGLWTESNVFTVQILGGAFPADAGTITGATPVCAGTTATYSVEPIAYADTYVWTLPEGAGITAGTNTNTITVQFTAATAGTISVYGTNACGTGTAGILPITVNPVTGPAGTITGPTLVGINTSATYSVDSIVNAASYTWTADGANTNDSASDAVSVTFGDAATVATIAVFGTNAYGCGNGAASSLSVQVITGGQQPGGTGTMQEFKPVNDTAGSTWTLTDTRADAGGQTYKVRLMEDGRYWMVQDLKYPTQCNKTTFAGATDAGSAGRNGISGFLGDCRSNTYTDAGYLYDWMFAMQNAQAYYNSSWNPGCTNNPGTKAECRGICPEGWHLPTGNPTSGEFTLLNNATNGGRTNTDAGLRNNWGEVYGGYSSGAGTLNYQGSYAIYWSSSYFDTNYAHTLTSNNSSSVNPRQSFDKFIGLSVRCIRNY